MLKAKKYPHLFHSIKKVILFIFNYKCNLCGVQTFKLEVHHINKNVEDNAVKNLIPLCTECHKLVHKRIKYKPFEIHHTIRKRQKKLQKLINKYW